MPALRQSVDLGGGRRAAYEVIGDGPPLFYFQGGPGFNAALLRPDAELLADSFVGHFIRAEARDAFAQEIVKLAG